MITKENYNVRIEKDIFFCLEEDQKNFNQKSRNSLINKLVSVYLEIRSKDDVWEVMYKDIKSRTEMNLKMKLKDKNSDNQVEEVLKGIDQIIKTNIYKSVILKSTNITKILNFRLNKETIQQCNEDNLQEGDLNTEFFRIVFEWYYRKPKFQRERILFYNELKILEEAIEQNYEVNLNILGLDKKTSYKPVGLFHTKDENFNYLLTVGEEEKIYPTRISNLLEVSHIKNKKFKLEADIRNKIDEKIEYKNYTWSNIEEIKVKLTNLGYLNYERIQHLRPQYISLQEKEDKVWIMTFREPTDAIYYYFTKFGKEAEILEPVSLRKKFKEFYENALKEYEEK